MLARLRLAFFRAFFPLLLLFIGVAEWACLAWMLRLGGITVPPVLHLIGPLAVLAANRRIIVRRAAVRSPRALGVLRLYTGFAFGSIFCGLFLGLAAVPWALGQLVAPALASHVPVEAGARIARAYLWLVNGGFLTVAGLMVFGYTMGQRALTVTRLTVPVAGLPPGLDGFTIVHLTDLHIGQYLDTAELASHVRLVNGLEPDLVCLTGDIVDRAEACARGFPTLAGLRARHGVLVTLGNHDVYAGADHVTEALRRLTRFTVLRNARVDVDVDGTRLPIVGLDDLGRDWARGVPEHPALPAAATGLAPDEPWILLSHRPDCFAQAARLGVSLMLSGHTHGGQLALPAWIGRRARNLAEFITDFDRGEYRRGSSTLYVNRGLGFTGQRIRLFTPREVACVELRSAAGTRGGLHADS